MLKFVVSRLSRIVVRRTRRRLGRSVLLRSYLRPYVFAYGLYRFVRPLRRQAIRVDLKRGETLQLERK